jgi:hypothetical protein
MMLSLKKKSGDAINQMPSEKAPSPDGFTGFFYKICWPIIKVDVVNAFACIHRLHMGPMGKLNSASISLPPKKDVADTVKDFRPISLIHSFAKIVSKVLALRLQPIIDGLISTSQSAFIKKRCIQDNFLYIRNLARAYHHTKTPALLENGHLQGLRFGFLGIFVSATGKEGFSAKVEGLTGSYFQLLDFPLCFSMGFQGLQLKTRGAFVKAIHCRLIFSFWQLTHFKIFSSWQQMRTVFHPCVVDMPSFVCHFLPMMQLSLSIQSEKRCRWLR